MAQPQNIGRPLALGRIRGDARYRRETRARRSGESRGTNRVTDVIQRDANDLLSMEQRVRDDEDRTLLAMARRRLLEIIRVITQSDAPAVEDGETPNTLLEHGEVPTILLPLSTRRIRRDPEGCASRVMSWARSAYDSAPKERTQKNPGTVRKPGRQANASGRREGADGSKAPKVERAPTTNLLKKDRERGEAARMQLNELLDGYAAASAASNTNSGS